MVVALIEMQQPATIPQMGLGGGKPTGSMFGIMPVMTNADLDARAQQQKAISSPGEQKPEVIAIVSHIRSCFTKAADHRQTNVEPRLLDSLQRRLGVYPDDKLAKIRKTGGSEIYIKLSEVKCRAGEAWLTDIFAPADGKPWNLDPTPLPDLGAEEKQKVIQMVLQETQAKAMQMGQMPPPQEIFAMAATAKEQTLTKINAEAKRKAEGMERRIDDQFREGGFDDAWRKGLPDLTTLGTMVIKGPYACMTNRLTWKQGQPVVSMDPVETYSWVTLWDCFPAPNSTDCQDGDYFIERTRWTYADLSAVRAANGYISDSVRAVLRDYKGGKSEKVTADNLVQQLSERPDPNSTADNGDIEGLIYHGNIPGACLIEINIDSTPDGQPIDPEESYTVEAWVIGNYCIRCLFNADPLKKRPYSKTTWAETPGSFWGRGMPLLMDDLQDICNATARAVVNNMGISSGPQVVINDINRLADGENITSMYPWKLWQFKNDGLSQTKALEFFQPDSNVDQLWALFERFQQMADDRTVPAYSYGSDRVAGAGQTASGLSMLLTAASRTVKLVIAKMDKNIFREIIERQYVRNMLYDPNPDIKGDVQIIARGALGMFVKEQQLEKMKQFMDVSSGPVFGPMLGEEKLMDQLREYAKQLQLPPTAVPTKEEHQAAMQLKAMQAQQMAAQQMQLTAGTAGVGGEQAGQPM